jgi:ribose transport system permease protein
MNEQDEVLDGGSRSEDIERRGTRRGTTNPRRRGRKAGFGLGSATGAVIGLIGVGVFLSIKVPMFLTLENLFNIFRAQSVIFILAVGMAFVILTGGLDLSIASTTSFAAMILAMLLKAGWPSFPAILVAIIAGAALGLINGMLIAKARISWFVATLGTMSIYASVVLVSTHGSTISLFSVPAYRAIGTMANKGVGGIPIILLIIVALYLLTWVVLHRTPFGRAIYAVGSNPEAARLNGLSVQWVTVAAFVIAGLMAGFAGVQQTGRLSAAVPTVDPNQMLAVAAAVLIGGMSLKGGEGGVLGTFLGALLLGMIQNGLTLMGISAFWQGTVTGCILLAAVGLAVARESGIVSKIWRRLRRSREGASAM